MKTESPWVRRIIDGDVLWLTIRPLSLSDMRFAPHVEEIVSEIREQVARNVCEAISEYNKTKHENQ